MRRSASLLPALCLTLAFCTSDGVRAQPSSDASPASPLSVAFLLDASGSMRENDPEDLRKAAAQAVVALLAPEDEVAVLEFEAGARILSGRPDAPWLSAAQRMQIFEAVSTGGNRGGFTDFRVGLQQFAFGLCEGIGLPPSLFFDNETPDFNQPCSPVEALS